jgi:primosomal protein N'
MRRFRNIAVGRLYFVSPREGERYYLCLLLHHVRGARSYDELKTFEGVLYPSFQEAAKAHRCDDNEWRLCLHEASIYQMGPHLRSLFAMILLYGMPAGFRDIIIEDLLHAQRELFDEMSEEDLIERAQNVALREISGYLATAGKTLHDYPQLPVPAGRNDIDITQLVAEHQNHNRQILQERIYTEVPRLNAEQIAVYRKVTSVVQDRARAEQTLFFLDGLEGTGKTFVYNLILAKVRSSGGISLASSGIAALLLEGGFNVQNSH